jgi:hypothetical protein
VLAVVLTAVAPYVKSLLNRVGKSAGAEADALIANYQSLAQDSGADPLGYYIAPQALC